MYDCYLWLNIFHEVQEHGIALYRQTYDIVFLGGGGTLDLLSLK